MESCKQCIHYDVCEFHVTEEVKGWNDSYIINDYCGGYYIDKSKVAEVKHGKWLEDEDFDIAICSECGDEYDVGDGTFKDFTEVYHYCPNCGAKMEL